MPETTELAVAADKVPATVPDKPLTPTQQKNLEKILEGDFADLREQTAYEINRQLDARLAEIDAEFGDTKKLKAAKDKLLKAAVKAQAALDKVAEEIEATGVIFPRREYHANKMYALTTHADSLIVEGKDDARYKAQHAADSIKSTAALVINRRHREAQRQVLLSGISAPAAADIVNSMPNAADIIGEVRAEVAVNNEADLDELHLNES